MQEPRTVANIVICVVARQGEEVLRKQAQLRSAWRQSERFCREREDLQLRQSRLDVSKDWMRYTQLTSSANPLTPRRITSGTQDATPSQPKPLLSSAAAYCPTSQYTLARAFALVMLSTLFARRATSRCGSGREPVVPVVCVGKDKITDLSTMTA